MYRTWGICFSVVSLWFPVVPFQAAHADDLTPTAVKAAIPGACFEGGKVVKMLH